MWGLSRVRSWAPFSERVSSKHVDRMLVENSVTETLGGGMRSIVIETYGSRLNVGGEGWEILGTETETTAQRVQVLVTAGQRI